MKIPRRFRALILMALPGVLILFFFDYMVMGGLVLAFKNFDYRLGIWSSPWSGIENFRFLIASRSTFFTITRNTLMYYVIFTVTGMILEISLAIAMDQLVFKSDAEHICDPGIYIIYSCPVHCLCVLKYGHGDDQSSVWRICQVVP